MVIIETPLFTKRIIEVMSDDSYREFQNSLIAYPEMGKIIQGSGGLRKVRWGISGQGKQGGARIIYYWAVSINQIYMLMVYSKNEQVNLTKEQLSILKKLVQSEFNHEQ